MSAKDHFPVGSREVPVKLAPRAHFHVQDANGDVWALTVNESGGLQAWLPSGGTVLTHNGSGNVADLYAWSSFQRVRPPTADRPAVASRDLVLSILPNSDGLATEYVDLVQEELDREPALKPIVEAAVHRVLEVVPSTYGGTRVEPRDKSRKKKY